MEHFYLFRQLNSPGIFTPPVGGGDGAPSFVSSGVGHNETSQTTTVTGSWTVTSGNVLAMMIHTADATSSLSSVAQTAGTATIGTVTTATIFQSGGDSAFYAWCQVTGSGTITLTATMSVGVNTNIAVHELSGANVSAPIAASIGQRLFMNSTATDAITSTAATPSANNCYIMGMVSVNGGTIGSGTGFTTRIVHTATATWHYDTDEIIQGTAASIAATFTASVAPGNGGSVSMIAIKP